MTGVQTCALPICDSVEIANKVLDALGKADDSQGDIELTSDLAACVADSDLVIETIPEDINLKLNLFRQLESLVSKECVLASDSSGIPVSKLQEGRSEERRVGKECRSRCCPYH